MSHFTTILEPKLFQFFRLKADQNEAKKKAAKQMAWLLDVT